jgi:hypothetical protein
METAKIFGFPGSNLLGSIPVFELVWWVKYCAPLFLALALLAGLGLESLVPRKWPLFAVVGLLVVWGELTALRPGPHPAPHNPLTPAPYITWLEARQAEEPDAFLCGVGKALMPMTATAFHLKDIRMEDTLIDRDQYRILFEGISSPKPRRLSMFITLDELDSRRLETLRSLGVKWLVAGPGWEPAKSVASALSPAYTGEMTVWRVSNSRPFHGFPQRGKRPFLAGLWITLLITPALLAWGLIITGGKRR